MNELYQRIHDLLAPERIRFETVWEDEGDGDRVDGKVAAGGCCDCWAYRAADTLRDHGFNVKVRHGDYEIEGKLHDHWWAEVDGEVVVDCSADQYDPGLDRVVIGTYAELPSYRKTVKRGDRGGVPFPGDLDLYAEW